VIFADDTILGGGRGAEDGLPEAAAAFFNAATEAFTNRCNAATSYSKKTCNFTDINQIE
jgi:hypothetical protein